MSAGVAVRGQGARHRRLSRRIAWLTGTREGIVGLALLLFVVGVALIGPRVAPHTITETIGAPGAGPSAAAPLGTDFLGRDVLSRVLHGGVPVFGLALASMALTYLIGIVIGLSAGLSRSALDPILMRGVDVFLVFPPLLLLLVLITGAGSGTGILIVGIALVLFPGVARIVRTATMAVSTQPYVEAAVARGERRLALMRREILPNIAEPVLADFGIRFSGAIILAASVNFLGLGSHPPAANWALMISENRVIIGTNPWAVLVPAALLALVTISVNLFADAYIKGLRHEDSR
jgi:ABC-type dipeptide/oligopeptide/nickel transport system permease subunit